MQDIIIVAIILVIVGLAVRYIYKAKKSGAKCIGCSVGDCSGHTQGCGCGCGRPAGVETSQTSACRCGQSDETK